MRACAVDVDRCLRAGDRGLARSAAAREEDKGRRRLGCAAVPGLQAQPSRRLRARTAPDASSTATVTAATAAPTQVRVSRRAKDQPPNGGRNGDGIEGWAGSSTSRHGRVEPSDFAGRVGVPCQQALDGPLGEGVQAVEGAVQNGVRRAAGVAPGDLDYPHEVHQL
jgi:hypothetical protein